MKEKNKIIDKKITQINNRIYSNSMPGFGLSCVSYWQLKKDTLVCSRVYAPLITVPNHPL